jgi:Uncharacterised protein family (UPF0081)
MSRIVAIDYGRKRTGIAVSDTLQLIANGLTTVPTHELLNFIGGYVAKRTGRADYYRIAQADE